MLVRSLAPSPRCRTSLAKVARKPCSRASSRALRLANLSGPGTPCNTTIQSCASTIGGAAKDFEFHQTAQNQSKGR